MTIKEAINKATMNLKTENIEEPKLKARLLMQFILKQTRQYLIIYDEQKLTPKQEEKYFHHIEDMKNGVPLQHITHKQEFMKMDFYVDDKVLIPRPDTEVLVEEVLKVAERINARKILDLCTGSGAIAISLAKYRENCQITAVDISQEALNVAKKNARKNGVDKQIVFCLSDLFEDVSKEKYDIIVSNPPYIKKEIVKILDKEVQKEPRIALDGGKDGLDFYRKILHQSHQFLMSKGYLCLEIGYDQKTAIKALIEQEGKYQETYSKKDLCGKDRIFVTKRKD